MAEIAICAQESHTLGEDKIGSSIIAANSEIRVCYTRHYGGNVERFGFSVGHIY